MSRGNHTLVCPEVLAQLPSNTAKSRFITVKYCVVLDFAWSEDFMTVKSTDKVHFAQRCFSYLMMKHLNIMSLEY